MSKAGKPVPQRPLMVPAPKIAQLASTSTLGRPVLRIPAPRAAVVRPTLVVHGAAKVCKPPTVIVAAHKPPPRVLVKAAASSVFPVGPSGSSSSSAPSPKGHISPILLNALKAHVMKDQRPPTSMLLQLLSQQKAPLTVHPSFAPLQQGPKSPAGLPPVFIEQLKEQMSQAEGISGKPCRFGRICKSVDCPNQHKEGREIEDDPQSLICKFGRRCKRKECFYVHASGRELDEDPSKGICKHAESCNNPGCFFSHPETRKLISPLKCFICGAIGHVQKQCPIPDGLPDLPYVKLSKLPEDWVSNGADGVCSIVTAELEVFGELAYGPKLSEGDGAVLAAFADPQATANAIETLKHGSAFDIEAWELPDHMKSGRGAHGRDKQCTVFIGNVPLDTEEDELKELFERVGIVVSLRLVYEKDTKQPKGFGFCDFADQATARRAISEFHGESFKGRKLRVNSAEKALGDQKNGDAEGTDRDPAMIIKGFPLRWSLGDLCAFLREASNKITDSCVTMLPPGKDAEVAAAKVIFRSEAEVQRAWWDLADQKIAGKALSLVVVGCGQDAKRSEGSRGERRSSRSRSRGKHCTVFVGNVPHGSTEEEMQEIFSRVGDVSSFRIVYDKNTRQAKGYGFCEFEDPIAAQDAVRDLHGMELNGRRLRVTPAETALGTRSKNSSGVDQEAEIVIEGFPNNWDSSDLDEFLGSALSNDVCPKSVVILRAADDQAAGRARVFFESHSDAQSASCDLDGQEIDGVSLSVFTDKISERTKAEQKRDGDRARDRRTVSIHIDELSMPRRPVVDPLPADREVFVDPFPDDDDLADWLSAFGEVEETYRIPDQSTGDLGDRGYVLFKEHEAASRCVDSGSATWSESERTLASQRSRQGGRGSVYPDSIIARILGPRGEHINGLKSSICAHMLAIRGDGLGNTDQLMSTRVHFVCKGSPSALSQLQPALERALAKVHDELRLKLDDPETARRRSPARQRSRSPRQRSRSRRRSSSHGKSRHQNGSPWFPPPDNFASCGGPPWDPWSSHGPPQAFGGVWPPQAWMQQQDSMWQGPSWKGCPQHLRFSPGPWGMPPHSHVNASEWAQMMSVASSSSEPMPWGASHKADTAGKGYTSSAAAPAKMRRLQDAFENPNRSTSEANPDGIESTGRRRLRSPEDRLESVRDCASDDDGAASVSDEQAEKMSEDFPEPGSAWGGFSVPASGWAGRIADSDV
eukprot:TRINITY_DN9327_c0_g2_i1.p1 TRINITY_DN9327_c0_g2~~TRINITY_DN9327_c0_g2_i1.p1  ORF type:complete len:1212 (+),score=176.85 TRINITY_DN9327_c0_g2_i1:44-3679(+)